MNQIKSIEKLMKKAKPLEENVKSENLNLEDFQKQEGEVFFKKEENSLILFKKNNGKFYRFGYSYNDSQKENNSNSRITTPVLHPSGSPIETKEEIKEVKQTPKNMSEWVAQANEVIKKMSLEINSLKIKINQQDELLKEIPRNFIELINPLRKKLNLNEVRIKEE